MQEDAEQYERTGRKDLLVSSLQDEHECELSNCSRKAMHSETDANASPRPVWQRRDYRNTVGVELGLRRLF